MRPQGSCHVGFRENIALEAFLLFSARWLAPPPPGRSRGVALTVVEATRRKIKMVDIIGDLVIFNRCEIEPNFWTLNLTMQEGEEPANEKKKV